MNECLEKWKSFWEELGQETRDKDLKEDLKDFPFSLIKIRQDYLLESPSEYIQKVFIDNLHKYYRKYYLVLEQAKKWKTW